MGAKIASFLATLLLSVPLAAIGLMAIFGIPQLVPAIAGPDANTMGGVVRQVRDALPWKGSAHSDESSGRVDLDDAPAYQPTAAKQWPPAGAETVPVSSSPVQFGEPLAAGTSAVKTSAAIDTNANSRAPAQAVWNEEPRTTLASAGGEAPRSLPTASASPLSSGSTKAVAGWDSPSAVPGPLLSWRQAALRLTELGIGNYHLERGAKEGSFLFVCVYSPGDAPQITHRFESEAEDPLVAVNQVLRQVDVWMSRRFASSNFPTRPQSLSLSTDPQLR